MPSVVPTGTWTLSAATLPRSHLKTMEFLNLRTCPGGFMDSYESFRLSSIT